ncbi:hypothetical protein ANO11243_043430 [Dothideomycetidae sp. 11243]|nr:hypothetical protein ANO11243_043430 [fungal sp. No.11243]
MRHSRSFSYALAAVELTRPVEGSSPILEYCHLLERLKLTKREGWRRFGVNHGESISDHMWRMAMLTMIAPPPLASQLDLHKCMKMALIHDIPESLVGDLTPADAVPKPEKFRREALTMDFITKDLLKNVPVEGMNVGRDMEATWQEFEEGKTLESRFVQDLDKIELLLQMVEYEKRGRGRIDLSQFSYVATKILLSENKPWVNKILEEREQFWSAHGLTQEQIRAPDDMKSLQDNYYGR